MSVVGVCKSNAGQRAQLTFSLLHFQVGSIKLTRRLGVSLSLSRIAARWRRRRQCKSMKQSGLFKLNTFHLLTECLDLVLVAARCCPGALLAPLSTVGAARWIRQTKARSASLSAAPVLIGAFFARKLPSFSLLVEARPPANWADLQRAFKSGYLWLLIALLSLAGESFISCSTSLPAGLLLFAVRPAGRL